MKLLSGKFWAKEIKESLFRWNGASPLYRKRLAVLAMPHFAHIEHV